jgi:hypothetical protein
MQFWERILIQKGRVAESTRSRRRTNVAKLDSKMIGKIQALMSKKDAKALAVAHSLGVSVKAVRKYTKAAPVVVEKPSEPPKAESPKVESPKVETSAIEKPAKEPKALRDYAVLFSSHVTRQGIEKAAASLEPRKIRKHAVVVGGKTFPVCQLVAAAASIPEDRKQFFTSEDAKRVLTQLQFEVVTSQTAQPV